MYNQELLKRLEEQNNKIVYAKIIALDINEQPLEQVEGSITSGSISIDGASAIRRTCQLSLVTDKIGISNYYWGLNTKFRLSIGVEDLTNKDIIWFEQGLYIITSLNISQSINSYTVNLSGKDKMCLLNGEVSGSLNSSVDFGQIDEQIGIDNNGNPVFKTVKYPIKDIIREAVHQYGGEPFHNIIINDLEEMGLELQEYRYDTPMYIWRLINNSTYSNGTLNGQQAILGKYSTLNQIPENEFESLTEGFMVQENKAIISFADDFNNNGQLNQYYVAKIDYGESAGYREIDLVYPDDLIGNAGESITSILDKLKNFLGDFEYFYNLDGQFVFQRKKDYISTTWNPSGSDVYFNSSEKYSYIFSDNKKFTAIGNTPNLLNLKNDFSVWGSRKNVNASNELPIHMRYAIDKKPIKYTSIHVEDIELQDYNIKYGFNIKGQNSIIYIASDYYLNDEDNNTVYCDWRELIYQMARDYRKYNHLDNFALKIIEANNKDQLYRLGKTGYEQYYIDIEGFWRQLYNPVDGFSQEILNNLETFISFLEEKIKKLENQDILTEEEYNELVTMRKQLQEIKQAIALNDDYYIYEKDTYLGSDSRYGWARNVYNNPELLNFWLDFLDTSGELEEFSIPALGDRPKVVNDKDVKSIYYRDIPAIIFQDSKTGQGENSGYRYFNAPNMKQMFIKGARGKSAKEVVDTLLYNYSYCIESINITSIPLYYLEPNTCIYINDIETGIQGEYAVSKISISLAYNGTMNIVATKLPQRLF